MLNRHSLLLLTALFATLLALTPAVASDPYNYYLWNRENIKRGNGEVDRGPWFEWWYYKVVDPVTNDAFHFTYGVVNPWDLKGENPASKAFMQFGDFKNLYYYEQTFPLQTFQAKYDATDVRISGNHATNKGLSGELTDPRGHHISWKLRMKREWQFQAMGWTVKAPFSGIYWYPAQASARMDGWIKIDQKTYRLKNVPAYQDRNWGRTFPKWWTWITANIFEKSPGSALAIGGGEPKLFDSVYLLEGLCIGFKHREREYAFRTTDFLNWVDFEIKWGKWHVVAQNAHGQRIEVDAYAPAEKFMDLTFPTPQGPIFHDYEALLGDLRVRLFEYDHLRGQWRQITDLRSSHAGIEWGTPHPIPFLPDFRYQSQR